MIKNILFDLDGTLIKIFQEKFNEKFYKIIYLRFLKNGYDAETLSKIMLEGIKLMVFNDGKVSNEEVLWSNFEKKSGIKREVIFSSMKELYDEDFDTLKDCIETVEVTGKAINELYEKGYNLILATNPLFPLIAVTKRAGWGNIDCNKFSYITSYENSSFSKPNINYYKEIIEKNNLNIEEIMMFGNDTIEDLSIEQLGIPCYIITNNVVNPQNLDRCTKKGDYNEFYSFISNLPKIN